MITMTSYYYYISSGSIDSTTSIKKARKQSIKYLKEHREQYTTISTNSYGSSDDYCEIITKTKNKDVFIGIKKGERTGKIVKKDGSLGIKYPSVKW